MLNTIQMGIIQYNQVQPNTTNSEQLRTKMEKTISLSDEAETI